MICIATVDDRGWESLPDVHLHSVPHFVFYDTVTGQTTMMVNHKEHHKRGARRSLKALTGQAMNVVRVDGMGLRAFARPRAAGLKVLQAGAAATRESIAAVLQGQLTEFTSETACHGHGHGHGIVTGDEGESVQTRRRWRTLPHADHAMMTRAVFLVSLRVEANRCH